MKYVIAITLKDGGKWRPVFAFVAIDVGPMSLRRLPTPNLSARRRSRPATTTEAGDEPATEPEPLNRVPHILLSSIDSDGTPASDSVTAEIPNDSGDGDSDLAQDHLDSTVTALRHLGGPHREDRGSAPPYERSAQGTCA